jgi:hypothetical protein
MTWSQNGVDAWIFYKFNLNLEFCFYKVIIGWVYGVNDTFNHIS